MATTSRKQLREFAERVSNLRHELRLTQTALAQAAGVTQSAIWNWENGNVFPRAGTLRDLARALGTTAEYLATGKGVASTEPEPTLPSPQISNLNDVIQKARFEVAQAAGLTMSQVRIVLDYGG